MDSETDLVERLRHGDEVAFALIVARYHPTLLRVAESTLRNRAVAEEAVQDTWLAVLRGVDHFEGRSSLKTWLFHILRNRVRTAADREARTGGAHDELDPLTPNLDERAIAPAPWEDEVDRRLLAEQVAHRALELLGQLPTGEREVVELRDLEGLTAGEVASRVGVTDGYQRVLLHRGHAHLRELLSHDL